MCELVCVCVHAGRGGADDVSLGAAPAANLQQHQQGASQRTACSFSATGGCWGVLQV